MSGPKRCEAKSLVDSACEREAGHTGAHKTYFSDGKTAAEFWSTDYAGHPVQQMNQRQAARPPLDLNGNGVDDTKEPWFWGGVWKAAAWLVRTFTKPHTLVHKAVVAAEAWRAAELAKRESRP